MLLEKSLKPETELEEISSHHTSLVGQWLAGIWILTVLVGLSAEGVESGHSNGSETLKVGVRSFFRVITNEKVLKAPVEVRVVEIILLGLDVA